MGYYHKAESFLKKGMLNSMRISKIEQVPLAVAIGYYCIT